MNAINKAYICAIKRPIFGSLVALLLLSACPVAALAPSMKTSEAAESTGSASAIAAERSENEDQRIKDRISGIFAEIPSLAGVSVKVDEGVVTLGGTVVDSAAKSRAEGIASRVQGVATIENGIERDVSVNSGLKLTSLSDRLTAFLKMLPLIVAAIVVALLISALGHVLASMRRLWRRLAPTPFMSGLIASAIRFIFTIGGIIIALDMIGAGTLLGAVLGGAGVAGIALGFAMRETIENYVASLMLSVRQPFRANDHVLIDTYEGRVVRLSSRATILITPDGNHLRIPNSLVFRAVILNYTRNPQRRFDFDLGIAAHDDPTAASALGVKALSALGFVLKDPRPQARVMDVGESNIVIRFFGWVDQNETDWSKARSLAIPAVKKTLEDEGFALPEPIYRLRFDEKLPPLPQQPAPGESRSHAPAGIDAGKTARDTLPQEEVARMVDAERARSDDHDLLDDARPVE